MTYKFYDRSEEQNDSSIEIWATNEKKLIIESQDNDDFVRVELNENDLFNLIGGLLRLQSEIKKIKKGSEVVNG